MDPRQPPEHQENPESANPECHAMNDHLFVIILISPFWYLPQRTHRDAIPHELTPAGHSSTHNVGYCVIEKNRAHELCRRINSGYSESACQIIMFSLVLFAGR